MTSLDDILDDLDRKVGVSDDDATDTPATKITMVHIHGVNWRGKKYHTTIEGLDFSSTESKSFLKCLRKEFHTGATIFHDAEKGTIYQVNGDRRREIREYLVKKGVCTIEQVKVHGA